MGYKNACLKLSGSKKSSTFKYKLFICMKMMTYIVLFLFLATVPSLSQSRINPCLYNREDVLPCKDYANSGVASPRANQYTVHATRFRRNAYGLPVCVLRKQGELVEDIEDLGTPDVKFLFSPGAERSPNINYVNQMLVEYNMQCQAGQLAFIQFDKLDLEPRNCRDGTTMRCQDYIEIDTGKGGSREYCGNDLSSDPVLVGTGRFTLKMRTSFFNSYSGFRIFVICFNREDRKDCTDSLDKSGATEIVDLSVPEGQARLSVTLTSAEKKTLSNLGESLYTTAFTQARNKIASWPPASYSQNEPGDILDLSELGSPVVNPIIHPSLPVDTIKKPIIGEPIIIEPIVRPIDLSYRKKKSIFEAGGRVHLDSKATMEAVRNENACNPIVHSVTKSYLTVAQRLEPAQLREAQQEYQQEISRLS